MSQKKKALREQFRSAVFERDNHKCRLCDCNKNLDAHHITDRSKMPNGGYTAANGISLCPAHHLAAELFHLTDGKEFHEGMHPNDLYAAINSSHELALEKSKQLK